MEFLRADIAEKINKQINATLGENLGNVPAKFYIQAILDDSQLHTKDCTNNISYTSPNVWSSKHTNHSCILKSTHFKKQ